MVIPVGLLVLVCPPNSCTYGRDVLEGFEALETVFCMLGCDISIQNSQMLTSLRSAPYSTFDP